MLNGLFPSKNNKNCFLKISFYIHITTIKRKLLPWTSVKKFPLFQCGFYFIIRDLALKFFYICDRIHFSLMTKKLHEHVCEESVFAMLYKKHAKNLRDFLYYKFGEHLNPEDHVQEAFVKLWKKCKDVPPEKAKSFLFTVANNLVLNEVKHQKVVLKFQQQKEEHNNHQDPQFLLEETEYLKKYQTALSNLTEAQRTAFLLNRAEGKKHQEIADMLGISKKAVEKRIYGALKKLREEIKGI